MKTATEKAYEVLNEIEENEKIINNLRIQIIFRKNNKNVKRSLLEKIFKDFFKK